MNVIANTVMFYSQVAEVAGIKDRFFQISSYADLENLFSSMEKSIIEGKPKYLLINEKSVASWKVLKQNSQQHFQHFTIKIIKITFEEKQDLRFTEGLN